MAGSRLYFRGVSGWRIRYVGSSSMTFSRILFRQIVHLWQCSFRHSVSPRHKNGSRLVLLTQLFFDRTVSSLSKVFLLQLDCFEHDGTLQSSSPFGKLPPSFHDLPRTPTLRLKLHIRLIMLPLPPRCDLLNRLSIRSFSTNLTDPCQVRNR